MGVIVGASERKYGEKHSGGVHAMVKELGMLEGRVGSCYDNSANRERGLGKDDKLDWGGVVKNIVEGFDN